MADKRNDKLGADPNIGKLIKEAEAALIASQQERKEIQTEKEKKEKIEEEKKTREAERAKQRYRKYAEEARLRRENSEALDSIEDKLKKIRSEFWKLKYKSLFILSTLTLVVTIITGYSVFKNDDQHTLIDQSYSLINKSYFLLNQSQTQKLIKLKESLVIEKEEYHPSGLFDALFGSGRQYYDQAIKNVNKAIETGDLSILGDGITPSLTERLLRDDKTAEQRIQNARQQIEESEQLIQVCDYVSLYSGSIMICMFCLVLIVPWVLSKKRAPILRDMKDKIVQLTRRRKALLSLLENNVD